MMMTRERQIAVLGGLLVVWAGVTWWAMLSADEPQRVPLVNVGGVAGGTTRPSHPGTNTLRVHLAQLKQSRVQRAAAATTSKNIFELRRSDQIAVVPPVPPPPPDDLPPDIPEPSAQDVQADSAWAELGQFRYLGYLELGEHGRKREEIALLGKRDVLHTVRRGEIIGAGILVAAITPNTVVLRHQASQIEQRLTLSEETP